LVPLKCLFAGVCERCGKLELRRCVGWVVKLRFALYHKAASGPVDLSAHRSARIRSPWGPMSVALSGPP